MFTKNWYMALGNSLIDARNTEDARQRLYYRLVNIDGELLPDIENYGYKYNTDNYTKGRNIVNYCSEIDYINNHLKISKESLICDKSSQSSSTGHYGVVFGNGTEPESINNYTMSGDLFVNYTSSATTVYDANDEGNTRSITYTLTNNGTEDFTISEIGLFGYAYITNRSSDSKNYRYDILIERTLLETPITIPANGGVGQVTYTLRMNYPTE